MTAADPGVYAALARQTHDVADHLAALADAMETASFHADGLPPAKLREVANTLKGTAMRAAMAADDLPLLNELTGRTWTRLDPDTAKATP